jgi:hypothetical protein
VYQYIAGVGSVSSLGSKLFGFDAVSMYGVSWLNDGVPYQDLVATEIMQWEYFRSIGLSVVPHVTTGWDKRPRFDNPVFWEPPSSPSNWVEAGTPEEISAHAADAVSWVSENPEVCPAKTVLIYAWNEFDEGGWLCPTLPEYEGVARIEAMHNVLNNTTENISATVVIYKELSLYPNPAKHQIWVRGITGPWVICDMYGNVKIRGCQNNIDISSLAPGVYVFTVQGRTEKLVVEASQ